MLNVAVKNYEEAADFYLLNFGKVNNRIVLQI